MNSLSIFSLTHAALRWEDTPYADNGCTRGVAASCHGLVWALYQEAGWEHGITLGDGPSRWAGNLEGSPLCEFMEGQADKFRAWVVKDGETFPAADVKPADLLGFKVGSEIRHAGIALPGGWFVHSIRKYGVQIRSLADPTWSTRLARVWRPHVLIRP
jgi:cell wall-associated NlpC family hydrolase